MTYYQITFINSMKNFVKNIYKEDYKKDGLHADLEKKFSCKYLQRYFPGMELLKRKKKIPEQMYTLPTRYTIQEWKEDTGRNTWKIIRGDCETNKTEEVNMFIKIAHLLNPIGLIKNEYTTPQHPLLPQCINAWETTLNKLHNKNNQAYVDTIANYICSKVREKDIMPNFVLQYGSIVGISEKYKFCISDEFHTYRMCDWFWKSIRTQKAFLKFFSNNEDITDSKKEYLENNMTCNDNVSVIEISSDTPNNSEHTKRSHSLSSVSTFNSECIEYMNTRKSSDDKNADYDSDNSSDTSNSSDDIDVVLEIPDMPVILICQEAHEGTMDQLLDIEEINGVLRGCKQWENMWRAWLFQVICTLTFLQKNFNMTHNDLHTNNIVWRNTTQKYLYYGSKDGTVWRVPTYGKIFSIIDFGRAIFQFGKNMWISDDHYPNNDASDQYNFGPFLDKRKKIVEPNMSFDLCRLAVSLIDGLFETRPKKKKGTKTVLHEEGSYKVMETISPLFNLLWSYTIDDMGKTVYENQYGNERYDGFDLYIQIARNVHSAVPEQQLRKPLFEKYIYKKKNDINKVYMIC